MSIDVKKRPTSEGMAARLGELASAGTINLSKVTELDAEKGAAIEVARLLAIDRCDAAAGLDATPDASKQVRWSHAEGAGRVHAPVSGETSEAGLAEEAVLEKLKALVGHDITITSPLGETSGGRIEYVHKGVVGVRDPKVNSGMPVGWPIDGIATFAVNGGRDQVVDHDLAKCTTRGATSVLRRDYQEILRDLHVAMSELERSSTENQARGQGGRGLVMRVLEEVSVSDWAMTHAFFPALYDWGTSNAKSLESSLKEAFKKLEAVRIAAPTILGSPEAAGTAMTQARLDFLSEAAQILDDLVSFVKSRNDWAKTPAGRAARKVIHDRMVGLGARAVESARAWHAEQDAAAAARHAARQK